MKRVTTHPNKRSRQERALVLAEKRVDFWQSQVALSEEKRHPIPPNARNRKASAEQKLARAEEDVKNLRAKGVTRPQNDDIFPYTVQSGIIVSPGKFEGEAAYMPEAYQQYLQGFGTERGQGLIEVTIEWDDDEKTVYFWKDDNGFIHEETEFDDVAIIDEED